MSSNYNEIRAADIVDAIITDLLDRQGLINLEAKILPEIREAWIKIAAAVITDIMDDCY